MVSSNWATLTSIFKARYTQVTLFLGYGIDVQYASPITALAAAAPYLDRIQARANGGRWLAVWGGDPPDASNPSLGYLMQLIKQRYNADLAAVISDGRPNALCDWCFFDPDPEVTPDGQTTVYGGVSASGDLQGGSRYYLGAPFATTGILKSIVVMGGGSIALQELQYADSVNITTVNSVAATGIPWRYVPSAALFPVYNSTLGPVNDLVDTFVAQGTALRAEDGTVASVAALSNGYRR